MKRPGANSPKVFGIGFQKTGTTSLEEALTILGYHVCGPVGIHDVTNREEALALATKLLPNYDAFQDNPWAVLYRELDAARPGSKFILTTRPEEAWIRSVGRHFAGKSTAMRTWIYGVGDPQGNEAVYLDRYRRHNREVREYFAGRDCLLELETGGDEDPWGELCSFLNHPRPNVPYPHRNKASDRSLVSKALRKSKRALKRLSRFGWND